MFRIITIEREFGSGAGDIARQLASRLGWRLWDNSMTEEIARMAKVECCDVQRREEKMDSPLYRLAKVFWRGSYERSMPLRGGASFDTDRMVEVTRQLIERAAEEGNCVIVGRGSPYFLRDRTDTFCVFLYARRAEKIARLVKTGKSHKEAEELVDSVDQDRIAFVKHYFNADWPTRCLYNMMLNTEMGDDNAVHTILETMKTLDRNPVGA